MTRVHDHMPDANRHDKTLLQPDAKVQVDGIAFGEGTAGIKCVFECFSSPGLPPYSDA